MDRDAALEGVGHLVAAVHVAGAHRHVFALASVALPEVAAVVALVRVGRRRRGGRRRGCRRVGRFCRRRRRRRCCCRGRVVLCQHCEFVSEYFSLHFFIKHYVRLNF